MDFDKLVFNLIELTKEDIIRWSCWNHKPKLVKTEKGLNHYHSWEAHYKGKKGEQRPRLIEARIELFRQQVRYGSGLDDDNVYGRWRLVVNSLEVKGITADYLEPLYIAIKDQDRRLEIEKEKQIEHEHQEGVKILMKA